MRALASLLLVAACGAPAPAAPDASPCAGADDLAPGLTRTGAAGATVTLVALDPDPPARFTNAWTIAATTAAGATATAADVEVAPFMPSHGHGPTVPPVVGDGAAGTVELAPLDLWMPGLWEIRIDVGGDRVTLRACIPE